MNGEFIRRDIHGLEFSYIAMLVAGLVGLEEIYL